MTGKKDKSTKALRDAKNAANVEGLTKLFPPKKQSVDKKDNKKK